MADIRRAPAGDEHASGRSMREEKDLFAGLFVSGESKEGTLKLGAPGLTPARRSTTQSRRQPVPPSSALPATKRRAPSSSTSASSQVTLGRKEYEHLLAVSGRFEQKAARAEEKLREAVVGRAKLQDEVESARREARHKESALRAQLEKADGTSQERDARKRDAETARRVEELRQIHKDDKAKWTARVAALETQLAVTSSQPEAAKDRGRLVQARVEWDAEKLVLLGSIREEKQTAHRAAKEKEGAEQEAARLADRIECLERRLEAAEEAAERAGEHSSTLEALLADASALYGRLAETSIERSTYETSRARVTELERELTTAQARLLPLRVSRQHQKDLAERVVALEELLSASDERADALQTTLQSLVNEAPAPRMNPERPPLEAFLSAETTAGCYATKAAIDAALQSHLVDRVAFLERRHRDLAMASFDDGLASSALTDELTTAVSSLKAVQLKLEHAERAVAQHTAEQATARIELAAVRSREDEARSVLALLQETQTADEAQHVIVERELRAAAKRAEEAFAVERETVKRLASTLGQSKVAQEALRSDLGKLQRALEDAHEFEAAYTSQLKENAVLAELTDLAEDEARTLAAQNAELLGNQNADQRITYLGKIRSELLDYKQHSVTLGIDLQEAERENTRLRDELASYRSVDIGSKPPTKLLRVSRQAPPPVHAGAGLRPPAAPPLGVSRSIAANGGRASVVVGSSGSSGRGSSAGAPSGGRDGGGGEGKERTSSVGGRLKASHEEVVVEEDWTAHGALTLDDLNVGF